MGISTLTSCGTLGFLKESVGLLVVGWLLPSQQHASVSQGWICSISACCHTETEIADQTFLLTQSQYIDTGPNSPSTDHITPGAWQGSHWSANFVSHWYDSTQKNPSTSRIRTPGFPLLSRTPQPLGQRGSTEQVC